MDQKLAKLDREVLIQRVRFLVNDFDATWPTDHIEAGIDIAINRAIAELPFRVASMMLMSRGDAEWRDPLQSFGSVFEPKEKTEESFVEVK